MKEARNKWGDSYQKNTECECDNKTPDLMFFGGYKKREVVEEGIYCHCKLCGGKIYYEGKPSTEETSPKQTVKSKEVYYMDTRSGNIIDADEFKKLKEETPQQARWYKEVPEELIEQLQKMNRKDRRAFYKKNKKLFKNKK